jgi:hypothetical protein
MKRDQLSTADTMRLVEVYRDAAKQHGEATEAGDHKTANKSADLISEVYAELRRRGADAHCCRSLQIRLREFGCGRLHTRSSSHRRRARLS